MLNTFCSDLQRSMLRHILLRLIRNGWMTMKYFIFIILLALTSCVIIEITDVKSEQADTVMFKRTKPYEPPPDRDTTEVPDTERIPIVFNPSVEDWEESQLSEQ